MRGVNPERKRLHEHEAVIFAFLVLFAAGGIVFWGYNAFAVEYYVGSSTESYSLPLAYEVLKGEEKIVDINVKNIKNDPSSEDVAVAILELDPKCTVVIEGKNVESGCESIILELKGDSTIYPNAQSIIRINFSSQEAKETQLVLNVVTSESIDQIIINFKSVDQLSSEAVQEVALQDDTIIERLINALISATQELSGDETSATKKEQLTYVDDVTGLAFTSNSLNFGTLNILTGEQSTIKFEVENLKSDAVELFGFEKPRGIIITPFSAYSLKSGERKSYEVTCSPTTEKALEKEILKIKTSLGDVDIGIICQGASSRETSDTTGPTVKLLEPIDGKVENIITFKIEAYDEGPIKEVAILKVYLGSNLIKRFITQMVEETNVYTFTFDSTRYSGIKDVHAEALDYSGNKGVSNRATLWINQPKVIPEEETKDIAAETKQTPIAKSMRLFVKKKDAKAYNEFNEVYAASGGVGDIRLTYNIEDVGEFNFEFKGSDIGNAGDVTLDDGYIKIKEIGNGKKIIDVTDTKLKEIVQTLGSETVVMPMLKPAGYLSPSDLNLVYYRSDGTSFDIADDDIVSITDEGDILKIEIRSEVILGTA